MQFGKHVTFHEFCESDHTQNNSVIGQMSRGQGSECDTDFEQVIFIEIILLKVKVHSTLS